jgi:hypothetical protein
VIKRLSSNISIKAVAIILALVTVLILVLPFFTGCTGTPSDTFTELLNLVPAEIAGTSTAEAPFFFTLIDYAAAYKDAGITFTTLEEFLEVIKTIPNETLRNLPAMGSFITGYEAYSFNSTIQSKYVGYDIGDVDAEIQFGTPPRSGVAAIGRFDPAATKNALSDQTDWPDWAVTAYTTENYNGVTIYSWGDGFQTHLETRLVPPHIDMLGRAMPLAVTDKYLFYHPEIETVKQMIDASQNKGKSLADLTEYASIADRLADLNVDQAIIGEESVANLCVSSLEDESLQLSEFQKETLIEKMGTPLKKFITFGSGYGKDEKGAFTAIVLYYENSSIARENVSLLKQHIENDALIGLGKTWSEFFTGIDIKAEGNILVAKLYGPSASFFASWIYSHDNLLYHEE